MYGTSEACPSGWSSRTIKWTFSTYRLGMCFCCSLCYALGVVSCLSDWHSPMGPKRTITSGHKSQVIMRCPLCGLCPPNGFSKDAGECWGWGIAVAFTRLRKECWEQGMLVVLAMSEKSAGGRATYGFSKAGEKCWEQGMPSALTRLCLHVPICCSKVVGGVQKMACSSTSV